MDYHIVSDAYVVMVIAAAIGLIVARFTNNDKIECTLIGFGVFTVALFPVVMLTMAAMAS